MTSTYKTLAAGAALIRELAPNIKPKVGLMLGSGLGPLADEIKDAVVIPYSELPGFPISTVKGHEGALILGYLGGMPIICLKGRVHLYECPSMSRVKRPIRMLKHLGCHSVILTNAAGSLRSEVGPGELVLINDHINFQHTNPVIGPNDEEYGARFFAMNNAYDTELAFALKTAARDINVNLHEGIYLSVLGPSFETPAEIRAFRILGADLVGMSTVPEVIVARHCGLKVAAISSVVNLAAGMVDMPPSHEETLKYGNIAAKNLVKLIKMFLEKNADELSK